MATAASSRILVISSTAEQAREFVDRVKAFEHPRLPPADASNQTGLSVNDSGSGTIPWTISNRYYTAEVHFESRVIHELASHHASGVPAVIYVWSRGEKYTEHVPALAGRLNAHDPEVSLAVRFGGSDIDDEDNIDEFLSSHGFEYIDGDRGARVASTPGEGFSEDEDSGIPGLPRVIDALSTIMWPNMVQSDATRNRKSRARELLGWAREEEEEDGLQALVASSSDPDTSVSHDFTSSDKKKSRMQREMEELERWLEEEDHSDARKREEEDRKAWVHAEAADSWADIPTPTIRTPHGEELGFDDDFDDFVGAPLDVSYGHDRNEPEVKDKDKLLPMHTGASYRSLGSMDDFYGDGHMFMHREGADFGFEDNQDDEFPSKEEIEAASRRIFGSQFDQPFIPKSSSSSSTTSKPSSSFEVDSASTSFSSFRGDGGSDMDDDSEFEFGAFDLSRVLSALQGMKEEIAGMSDENERRKAAARAALGLVYGLRKEDERTGDVP